MLANAGGKNYTYTGNRMTAHDGKYYAYDEMGNMTLYQGASANSSRNLYWTQ